MNFGLLITVFAAVAFAVLAFREISRASEFRRNAAMCDGEVVAAQDSSGDDNWTMVSAQFQVNGQTFTLEDRQIGRFRSGMRVPVLYSPADPSDARLGGSYLFRAGWSYVVVALIFAGFSAGIWWQG